jgi:hypothetical protein
MKTQSIPKTMLFLLTAIVFILACTITSSPTNSSPSFDPTKASLELQNTAVALQMTQAALSNNVPTQPVSAPAATVAPPPAASTTEAKTTPQAPQVPSDFQKSIDDYYQKGYLSTAKGEYHHLDDFSMDNNDRQVTFAKKKTGYSPKDFLVKAHFKWQSAIANPDPGGCGWSFRAMKNDSYLVFVDREYIFLGQMRTSQWQRYGKTSGGGWVGLGNPADADVAFSVNKGKAYVLVDDVLIASYTLDTDFLTGAGDLYYAVVAGTFKDYGTRCEMTNVNLWISNP